MKVKLEIWFRTLNLNAWSLSLYGTATMTYVVGVIWFFVAWFAQHDWWNAGRIIWVATAAGGGFRSLGDVADKLVKRRQIQSNPTYYYGDTKP